MKRIIFTTLLILSVLISSLPLTAAAKSAEDSSAGYTDIYGSWYSEHAVKYGFEEIFSDGTGMFNPNKKITRIEFVRLLHRSLEISIKYLVAPDVSKDFDDMKNTDIGANQLIDLVTTGIIEKGGSFNPDKQLDREVMIHWLINALKYKLGGDYKIPQVKPVPFKDDNQISDSYRSEVYAAVVLKLINGRGGNMLHPKQGATRAEAVTVVSRLNSLLDSNTASVSVTAAAVKTKNTLTMSLTLQNNTNKTVTINHTSGQHYDFKLFNVKGENLYTWSADKMFILQTNTTLLKPGEKVTYTEVLDSAAYSPIESSAVLMRAYIVGSTADFVISTNGYSAIINK